MWWDVFGVICVVLGIGMFIYAVSNLLWNLMMGWDTKGAMALSKGTNSVTAEEYEATLQVEIDKHKAEEEARIAAIPRPKILDELARLAAVTVMRSESFHRYRIAVTLDEYIEIRDYFLKKDGHFDGSVMGHKCVVDDHNVNYMAQPGPGFYGTTQGPGPGGGFYGAGSGHTHTQNTVTMVQAKAIMQAQQLGTIGQTPAIPTRTTKAGPAYHSGSWTGLTPKKGP